MSKGYEFQVGDRVENNGYPATIYHISPNENWRSDYGPLIHIVFDQHGQGHDGSTGREIKEYKGRCYNVRGHSLKLIGSPPPVTCYATGEETPFRETIKLGDHRYSLKFLETLV